MARSAAAGDHMSSEPPTLLFIFAHPDDESFSGAGTVMRCAAAGARSVLVTATLGERGKAGDPPVCAPRDLAACRARELREAAAIIGFDELYLLNYPDRELADAPRDEIRATLVMYIRRARPALVLTFDPNGVNLHPDHVAISRFTSDAVAAAADPRWHPEAGPSHAVPRLLWTPPITPWDAAWCDRLDQQAGADFVIDVSAWRERRIAALRAHRSQHLSIDRHFFSKPNLDQILATEIWRQAWGPALRARPATDVLEGV
jgi:N-acetylglucosamine malate deacetylase 2